MTASIPSPRRHHQVGYGWCGCEHPARHEPGCLHQLDDEHRAQVSAELAVDRFKCAELDPDDLCRLLVRIHRDPDYARRHMRWVTGEVAA